MFNNEHVKSARHREAQARAPKDKPFNHRHLCLGARATRLNVWLAIHKETQKIGRLAFKNIVKV